MPKSDPRYQCPHCRRSYIENKGRFCLKFTAKLNKTERKKAQFVFYLGGVSLTRECKYVYRGWNWNCVGFKKKTCSS